MRRRQALGLLLVAIILFVRPGGAAACSMRPMTLDYLAESAPIIALGVVREAKEATFILEVQRFLKGEVAAPTLTVNNYERRLLSTDCSMALGRGNHLAAGTQIIAFLRPDDEGVGADWQFSDPFMEKFIVVNDTDRDGRFIGEDEHLADGDIIQRREANGQPWFFHDNLGYPETVGPEVVTQHLLTLLGKPVSLQGPGPAAERLDTTLVVGAMLVVASLAAAGVVLLLRRREAKA